MISRVIKVEVGVISQSRRLRLITLTETLIIPDIKKSESNNKQLLDEGFVISRVIKVEVGVISQSRRLS